MPRNRARACIGRLSVYLALPCSALRLRAVRRTSISLLKMNFLPPLFHCRNAYLNNANDGLSSRNTGRRRKLPSLPCLMRPWTYLRSRIIPCIHIAVRCKSPNGSSCGSCWNQVVIETKSSKGCICHHDEFATGTNPSVSRFAYIIKTNSPQVPIHECQSSWGQYTNKVIFYSTLCALPAD